MMDDMPMAMVEETTPRSIKAVMEIDYALDELASALDRLYRRLQPILSPDAPVDPHAIDTTDYQGSSDLLQRMGSERDRIFTLARSARDMTERLEA